MDNSHASWAPRPALVAIGWVLAAAGALATVVLSGSAEPAGALFCGLGTVVVALLAAHGTLLRPRLQADAHGMRIRTLGRSRWLTWAEVHTRLVTVRRLGRAMTTMELDTETDPPQLVVFGWLELGMDPAGAHDQLETLRADSSSRE